MGQSTVGFRRKKMSACGVVVAAAKADRFKRRLKNFRFDYEKFSMK